MTTLSKLKEEGRREFDQKFPCLVKPVGYTFDRYGKKEEVEGMTYEKDNVMAFLTAQIEKAYLSALSDVEKGLPEKQTQEWVDYGENKLLRKQHQVAYNKALSAVKEVINKLKEKHEYGVFIV